MAGPEREESRQLLKHWKRFRGEKRLPCRDDIRMDELIPFASHFFLIDLESDRRFIIQHMGPMLIARAAIDATGLNILALLDETQRQNLLHRTQLMFDFGYAVCTHMNVRTADGKVKRIENLLLPIDNGPGKMRQGFGVIYYADGPDETTHHASLIENIEMADETFVDLGSGYAALIDISTLPTGAISSDTG